MRALLALAFVLFSALPALACSYEPDAVNCPIGQAFDSISCECKPLVSDLSYEDAEQIVTNPPAEFLACEKDSDCTSRGGLCDVSMPVNLSHASDFTAAANKANSVIKCRRQAGPEPIATPAVPFCVNSQCVLKAESAQ